MGDKKNFLLCFIKINNLKGVCVCVYILSIYFIGRHFQVRFNQI